MHTLSISKRWMASSRDYRSTRIRTRRLMLYRTTWEKFCRRLWTSIVRWWVATAKGCGTPQHRLRTSPKSPKVLLGHRPKWNGKPKQKGTLISMNKRMTPSGTDGHGSTAEEAAPAQSGRTGSSTEDRSAAAARPGMDSRRKGNRSAARGVPPSAPCSKKKTGIKKEALSGAKLHTGITLG